MPATTASPMPITCASWADLVEEEMGDDFYTSSPSAPMGLTWADIEEEELGEQFYTAAPRDGMSAPTFVLGTCSDEDTDEEDEEEDDDNLCVPVTATLHTHGNIAVTPASCPPCVMPNGTILSSIPEVDVEELPDLSPLSLPPSRASSLFSIESITTASPTLSMPSHSSTSLPESPPRSSHALPGAGMLLPFSPTSPSPPISTLPHASPCRTPSPPPLTTSRHMNSLHPPLILASSSPPVTRPSRLRRAWRASRKFLARVIWKIVVTAEYYFA